MVRFMQKNDACTSLETELMDMVQKKYIKMIIIRGTYFCILKCCIQSL